jgi:hypothetical protein
VYSGDRDDTGKRSGEGVFTYEDGRIFTGKWVDDLREGPGQMSWPDGSMFEGEYQHGLPNGHGTLTHADQSSYCGEWVDGKQSGQGTFKYSDGKSEYTGAWRNGEYHGYGQLSEYTGEICDKYVGHFANGTKEGKQRLFSPPPPLLLLLLLLSPTPSWRLCNIVLLTFLVLRSLFRPHYHPPNI